MTVSSSSLMPYVCNVCMTPFFPCCRHQILIKATSLGLKLSTSRGTKRRRDTDAGGGHDDSPSDVALPPPLPAHPSSAGNERPNASSVSPAGSTPHASPALSHRTHPPSSGAP